MNAFFRIILCLAVCATLAGLAGCEPKEPVNERQERLYSAENMELKKEISVLRSQFEKQMQAKQQELDKCNKDKAALEEQLSQETVKMFEDSLMSSLMEQVNQLNNENTQLKADIEALNKKLEQQE
jgi:CII-binding regulator of phage lambda lysogenization HflD